LTKSIALSGLDNLVDTIADMNDTTIATMEEVFRADDVRVELPHTNDNSALVAIHPQEASFKEFVARCNKEFPPPPPPNKPDSIIAAPATMPPTHALALPKPQREGTNVYITPVQPQPKVEPTNPLTDTMNEQPPNLAAPHRQ
jgi:hypothetical protein